MQDAQSHDVATLENQITERYGLLISQTQLAELLGRTTGGLRYSLSYPSDQSTRSLKACGRKIGWRVYYPATEVARIIIGGLDDWFNLQRCTLAVSHAAREWAWRQNLKPIPKSVLAVLGDHANDAGVCWPRIAIIAEKVGVSPRTVQRSIQHLVQRGLITVEERYRSDGSHTSNLYRLHLDRGVSVSPPPDRGDTTPGHECQGPGDTGVIPGTTIGTNNEPPQPQQAGSVCPGCGGGDLDELYFPRDLMPAERTLRVARTRETRQCVEASQPAIERTELPPPDENNPLVRRVQDMARRLADKKRVTPWNRVNLQAPKATR